jgi:asparagine synthase (glutamine-hydrolysing)
MKLQFGVLYRDQRTANAEDLTTLLGKYQAWIAETSGHAFDGPLLIGYRGDRITWEEDTETQPFALGPYKLTFDGRLDNRQHIAFKIGLNADRNLPDPVLIAKAYARYGDSILPDLIGEFALVLWRSDKRELTLVRSVEGSRPLYYALDGNRLLWCSSLAHLLRTSNIEPLLNECYLLDYLISDPLADHTPFATVNAVLSGTVLRFVNDRFLREAKLWNPLELAPLNCNSDAEYEELLRDKITEAVRVRLRAKATVFAELSGGKDSSAIVLVGDKLLRDEYRDPFDLRAISTVYDTSSTCDERHFIGLIDAARGIDSIYIHEDEQHVTMGFQNITFTGMPNPFDSTPGRFPRIAEHMKAADARVLLTGVGGDHIFVSTPVPEVLIADLLQERHLVNAHRCCQSWSRFTGNSYFSLLLKKALPLAFGFRGLQHEFTPVPPWLHANRRTDMLSRHQAIDSTTNTRLTPSLRFRFATVSSLFRAISTGTWNVHQYPYVSHPYTHRPLVEFCLSTPTTQFLRCGQTRSLLTRALAALFPPKIATRKGKGDIYEVLARAVERDWPEFGDVSKWKVCEAGYVRAPEFTEALYKMRMGQPYLPIPVLRVITLERFFRSLPLIRTKSTDLCLVAS